MKEKYGAPYRYTYVRIYLDIVTWCGLQCVILLTTILQSWLRRAVGSFYGCVREIGRELASYLNASVNAARVCCLGEDRRAYPVSTMSDCNGVRVQRRFERFTIVCRMELHRRVFVKRYILLHCRLISRLEKDAIIVENDIENTRSRERISHIDWLLFSATFSKKLVLFNSLARFYVSQIYKKFANNLSFCFFAL